MITASQVEAVRHTAKWKDNVGLMPHVKDSECLIVEFNNGVLGYNVTPIYYDWRATTGRTISKYAIITKEELENEV